MERVGNLNSQIVTQNKVLSNEIKGIKEEMHYQSCADKVVTLTKR